MNFGTSIRLTILLLLVHEKQKPLYTKYITHIYFINTEGRTILYYKVYETWFYHNEKNKKDERWHFIHTQYFYKFPYFIIHSFNQSFFKVTKGSASGIELCHFKEEKHIHVTNSGPAGMRERWWWSWWICPMIWPTL